MKGSKIEELFDKIPTGSKRALRVSNDNRGFRHCVENANKKGDVIINLGDGYFRPNFDDLNEVKMVNDYLEKERGRALSTLYKISKMQMSVNEKSYFSTFKEL